MQTISCNDYDYEKDRIKALVIFNNKLYEADQHFEAMIDILEDRGYNRCALYEYGNEVLEKMLNNNVKIAELIYVDNKESLLIYEVNDLHCFKKYYEKLPVYLYKTL